MDLIKILKGKEGTQLYSPLCGKVIFKFIDKSREYFPISCLSLETHQNIYFTREGHYFKEFKGAECILFPSRTNRNWEKFRCDLPKGTPVMVSESPESSWLLRYYAGDTYTYHDQESFSNKYRSQWEYIIPVSKFNFEDRTFNTKDNYGTANK